MRIDTLDRLVPAAPAGTAPLTSGAAASTPGPESFADVLHTRVEQLADRLRDPPAPPPPAAAVAVGPARRLKGDIDGNGALSKDEELAQRIKDMLDFAMLELATRKPPPNPQRVAEGAKRLTQLYGEVCGAISKGERFSREERLDIANEAMAIYQFMFEPGPPRANELDGPGIDGHLDKRGVPQS